VPTHFRFIVKTCVQLNHGHVTRNRKQSRGRLYIVLYIELKSYRSYRCLNLRRHFGRYRKYSRKLKVSRFPNTEPIHGESYLMACQRQRWLADHIKMLDAAKSKIDTGPPRAVISIRIKLKKLMVSCRPAEPGG
jgi:hypothetical protein